MLYGMYRMTAKTAIYGVLALSIAAALSTLVQSAPEAAAESLQTRLEAYWRARVQHNMPLALQYEHPAQRKQLGQKISLARMHSNVRIKEFTIVDPQALRLDPAVQEARVALTLKYEYRMPFGSGPMLTSTAVKDSWRKERGGGITFADRGRFLTKNDLERAISGSDILGHRRWTRKYVNWQPQPSPPCRP